MDGRWDGVIDVGETTVEHVVEAALPGPRCFRRSVITPQSCENVQGIGTTERDAPINAYTICLYNHDRHETFRNARQLS